MSRVYREFLFGVHGSMRLKVEQGYGHSDRNPVKVADLYESFKAQFLADLEAEGYQIRKKED